MLNSQPVVKAPSASGMTQARRAVIRISKQLFCFSSWAAFRRVSN
jgi:hypothetical protein